MKPGPGCGDGSGDAEAGSWSREMPGVYPGRASWLPGAPPRAIPMLRAWRFMDFGPDLSRLRRSALVIAESADAAMAWVRAGW